MFLIDASGNRFREISLVDDVGNGGQPSFPAFDGIKELGLDDTLLSWEDVGPAFELEHPVRHCKLLTLWSLGHHSDKPLPVTDNPFCLFQRL